MSTITQLLSNSFGGIRRKDAYFTQDKITCSDCQNVELFYTELNSGIGIRTTSGNIAVTKYKTLLSMNVYEEEEGSVSVIATDGNISNEELACTISSEEVSFARDSEHDITISNIKYYAWSDEESTVYTKVLENEYLINSIIPSGEQVIDIFETVQDAHTYMIAYTESSTKGRLYNIDIDNLTATLLVDNLNVTGKACGTDFVQGWLDMFVFSNGKNVKYIYTDTTQHVPLQIESDENIHLEDIEGRTVQGLGLVNFDDRLWIFDGKVLWYSEKGECRNFIYNSESVVTSAGYMEFVKNITAIYPYLGSLAVFHKNSSVLVELDSETIFKQSDESPGGCANYKSLVFHGTDLYFYDDTKKGVFSFKQIVIGDKTLGDNIALDIQDELIKVKSSDISDIKALSVVTQDRNEVWFLLPISSEDNYSIIMIFDYLRGEWIKRKCQKINGMAIFNNQLYTSGKDIYEEYKTKTFDGVYIPSYYVCSVLNLGADNTMKITKFPPRVTIDGNIVNDFYVKYVKNYNYFKTPKIKQIKSKISGYILIYDNEQIYDDKNIYMPDNINSVVKIPSATFKTLEITFYTETQEQSFSLKNLEFSRVKIKQV